MSNSQFQMNLLREINAIFKFHTSESLYHDYEIMKTLWKNYGKNSIWTNYAYCTVLLRVMTKKN